MAKVMLVEDDNNLREIYEARLLAEGYEIVSARDGEEALALAVKEKPDLIIADVMMPKISGFDMLDILRSTPETKNTKVIMMTALSQAEDKARAAQLGADRYLVKSQVTLEDVAKVAKEVMDGTPGTENTGGFTAAQPTIVAMPAPIADPTPVAAAPDPVPAPAAPVPEPTPPAVPEPVVAPVPAPVPMPEPPVTAAPADPAAAMAESTQAESADVQAQIASFANSAAGATESAAVPAPPVITEPQRSHNKIIQPLGEGGTATAPPDLQALLAKEAVKEQMANAIGPIIGSPQPTVTPLTAPTSGLLSSQPTGDTGIDPNTIAL
jgi:CheY-like chemotaxis protein